LNNNALFLLPEYKKLYQDLLEENFVIDKSGVKLVETIGMRAPLDPNELTI